MSSDLRWAIQIGDVEEVKKHVTKENVNDTFNNRTALHFAADYGQKEIGEFLIEMGAEVNRRDCYGISPLLAAVWEGHAAVVVMLLEKGADREVRAPNGTPLLECAETEELKALLLA